MSKIITLLLSLFILFSCSSTKNIETVEYFSYPYDYQLYGLDNDKCNLKASTVSTLKSSIDNKADVIFMVSSPNCSSCKVFAKYVNDIAIENQVFVYNIDPYSSLYPVYDTSDFNLLLDILMEVGINSEVEYVTPILLIVNKGIIDDSIVGNDSFDSDELLIKRVNQAFDKSSLIK